jgi:outer membrane biosynthesis protein TonB
MQSKSFRLRQQCLALVWAKSNLMRRREGFETEGSQAPRLCAKLEGLKMRGSWIQKRSMNDPRVKSQESKSQESRVKESSVKSQESKSQEARSHRVTSQESKSQESRVKSQESRVKSKSQRVKSQRVKESQSQRVKSQRVKSQELRVKESKSQEAKPQVPFRWLTDASRCFLDASYRTISAQMNFLFA